MNVDKKNGHIRAADSRLIRGAMLAAALVASAPPIGRAARCDEPQVASAPGPGTAAVVRFLEKLLEDRQKCSEPLSNLNVRGRVSRITKKWIKGAGSVTAETLGASMWQDFVLVRKDGRYRFETRADSGGAAPVRPAVRLFDGDALYALNYNSLDILPPADFDQTWFDAIYDFSSFDKIHDLLKYRAADSTLRLYIDRLTGRDDPDYFTKFTRVLRCYQDAGLLVLDNVAADGSHPDFAKSRYTAWFDPSKGYNLVRFTQQSGAPGAGLYCTVDTSVSYSEIATGVFFLASGSTFSWTGGTNVESRGLAGWGRRDVEVTDVQFGEFECDEKAFDHKQLPIPKGAVVTDRRKKKPASFIFGQLPLDEQVLAASVSELPTSQYTNRIWRWWFAATTIAVALVIAVSVARRNTERERRHPHT